MIYTFDMNRLSTSGLRLVVVATAALFAGSIGCGDEAGSSVPSAESCTDVRQALSLDVARGPSMRCTGVLRLDYQSLEPLGYSIVCGDSQAVDEATARATMEQDLDVASLPHSAQAELISDPGSVVGGNGDGMYVFYSSPADFGYVGAVSSRNGLTVFGGSIVWSGTGSLLSPQSWEGSADLGVGCGAYAPQRVAVSTFDLTGSESSLDAEPIIDAAWDTVLPGALLDGTAAYLLNAIVIVYPRTVGVFDPVEAEYVVLINAGWE